MGLDADPFDGIEQRAAMEEEVWIVQVEIDELKW